LANKVALYGFFIIASLCKCKGGNPGVANST
jgi:hypothetical protein